MIAPGQALRDGAAGIAAAAVGEPPFAPLGRGEVAADGAAKADRREPGRAGPARSAEPRLARAGRLGQGRFDRARRRG